MGIVACPIEKKTLSSLECDGKPCICSIRKSRVRKDAKTMPTCLHTNVEDAVQFIVSQLCSLLVLKIFLAYYSWTTI